MSENATYEQMLAQINPRIGVEYVFASVTELPPDVEPVALIREPEGITIGVTLEEAARAGLSTADPYTIITLSAPGSLDVVGLNSGIAQVLSSRSIPANIFSGIYHTHIFVPSKLAAEAKAVLEDVSGQAKAWLHM
ncbi:ACT domain-containing protein [uncultured Mobiluncus sp.]|uniref:ACT domain-containing protein n=1 Tax=uncultured Mobiluncus sp. TaxID=293425 RepID=UPI0025F6C2EC|nr:ACT domain-containing protein [uncultured Mobiluncus sp.]